MTGRLTAGAARRTINPPLGTRQTGFRLFGNPVQAIESDLTATAVVLADGVTRVVVIGIDLSLVGIDLSLRDRRPGQELRARVAAALAIPVSHVLLNTSHTHAGVALPDYMPDTPEQMILKGRYRSWLLEALVEAAVEANGRLQPARIGCGWGESTIGVYRRETRDGRDVLGEVPDHPIDPSVGVIRVDDLDGNPIATSSATRAIRSRWARAPRSPRRTFPGPRGSVVETSLGGLAVFLQGGGGNINPRAGMGLEVDCRDTKDRVGLELGGEVVKVAASIRTDTRAGERRPLGNVPDILFTPWERVEGAPRTHLAAAETARRARLRRPAVARRGRGILAARPAHARRATRRRCAGVGGPGRREARGLGAAARGSRRARAPHLRSLRAGDQDR